MNLEILLATIPPRRAYCERLLGEIARQTVIPACVHLVLDGYGSAPGPYCFLPVHEWRTPVPLGPGGRWRVARAVSPKTMLVIFDDDVVLATVDVVSRLVRNCVEGAAGAAQGITISGAAAPIGSVCDEPLICMGAAAMAVRAGDLAGLDVFADEVRKRCGFDPLGDLGDDEALVSAHLWRKKVPMHHVTINGLRFVEAAQGEGSQTQRRLVRGGSLDEQRVKLREFIRWPWPR